LSGKFPSGKNQEITRNQKNHNSSPKIQKFEIVLCPQLY
jgi:hypothetical protein